MLTKMFTVYAIRTTKDEYKWSYDEFFDTLEDAIKASCNYADWFRHLGSCTVDKILVGCGPTYKVEERWELEEGTVVDHERK